MQAAGITYRSAPRGSDDLTLHTHTGGRNFCRTDHDGHIWGVLSVSYARQESGAPAGSGVLALCKCKVIYCADCTKISYTLMRFDPSRQHKW